MTTGRPYLSRFSLEVLIDGHRETITVQPWKNCFQVFLRDRSVDVDVAKISENVYSLIFNGRSHHAVISVVDEVLEIVVDGICFQAAILDPKRLQNDASGIANLTGPSPVLAPMPGKVVKLLVAVGDSVKEGQGVVVIEAMKMQNELKAPKAGKIERVNVVQSQIVNAGDSLLVVH
jgi:biotin carboxyl carrier protein